MEMIEVKTGELLGHALDWAIAQIESVEYYPRYITMTIFSVGSTERKWISNFNPSTDWSHGGPLIEKHHVSIVYHNAPDRTPMACLPDTNPAFECGGTVLIAICRAIVAAKQGDTVRVPADLVADHG